MATTVVKMNAYGFNVKYSDVDQIDHTNPSTRTQLCGELVVTENGFIGIVQELDGIAASGTGKVALYEGDVIRTEQRADADTFVAGATTVYIDKQDNDDPASIRQASLAGRFPLNALVTLTENGADGRLEIRMPSQVGGIVAVS